MTNLWDQERTIQGVAKECRGLLTDFMVHLSHHDPLSIGIQLQDESGRFNLWAGNIGVFAPLQASLDFRLIDVPDIRNQFLRQLDTLNITLSQLNETVTQATTNEDAQVHDAHNAADVLLLLNHDIVELIQSTHDTIDWLHRLSNLVRKASFGSQNQRAARFPLKDEVGNDITESLAQIFKHLIKRECRDISEQMLDRLAQTMIIRRRRVIYRRSRQKRWALKQKGYRPRHLHPPAQLAPSEEVNEFVKDDEGTEVTEKVKSEHENRVQAAPSGLTVTTLDQQKYRQLQAPSRISRATIAPFQHNERLLVPPPPILAKRGREFVCDYCCLILPGSEAADDTWANHVKKDLDPYICVFDNCSQPYQIYSSSKAWLSHMRSEHRMSWRCVVRDHPPQTFETREAFINHMTQEHPQKFRKEQLHFIAESSARALSPTVPACPFCTQEPGDLENHVAQHLCHFALQSLPWPDHLDQDSENSSERDVNSSTSEHIERETLKDDLDDSVGLINVEYAETLDTTAEPLLETPVSWPRIERAFSEPDQILNEFAAHAARRARMAPNVNEEKPARLDDELRQIKRRFPDIVWNNTDMNSHLRASLRGPWGSSREHIMLNVQVTVPDAYPQTQAPSFLIEEDEKMSKFVHEKLQEEVHDICQLYLRRRETCLIAAFSYLLGLGDSVKSGRAFPLGDGDKSPEKTQVLQKSGYLTKKGKYTAILKSRFYVLNGQHLKYYDAEGGAQLGSIKLQGAQIYKQNAESNTSSANDTQLDHAMLILEPQKGSNMKRHILCAGNDEERDLWVEALLPWTNQAASDEMRTDSSTRNISRPISTGDTYPHYGADSSSESMWPTQIPVQVHSTNTKMNNKGQLVTVINHKQHDPPDEPSPSYRTAKTFGKRF